jgi:hypothetical protein
MNSVCVVPKVFRTRFTPGRQTQDSLDYPAKAEGGDYKTDRSRYENIAEASATNLEKLCRVQARACDWREHGAAQEAF